jgi:two-component system probable response regulator PhcQ
MEPTYDYRKFAILYVDDEEKSLRRFVDAFGDQFRILTASNAREGLRLLEEHKDEIGLLMTDQKMPGEKGVWLLEKARQLQPRIIRLLVTAYTDYDAAIAAINTGSIYKYVEKPWDPPQLENTLKRGLEFFMVQRERDQLLREKLSVLHNMMIADRIVSLGLLAAGLSHHIRNSLVAVKTFLDLAPAKLAEEKMDLNGLRNPDFWKEYYQNVQNQINRINNLLKDLWSAAEKPTFDFSDRVNARQVVEETYAQLQSSFAEKQIQFENQIPADLPALNVDKPKFYRLFELLLKDELASLPPGTRLVFTGEAVANGTGPEKQQVKIQLTDNGPGLPQEALRIVFDPFVVRGDTPMEYGIHLMACFFIVHHHGGRIEAHNTGTQGTTFTLRLPVNPAQSVPATEEHDFLQKVLLSDSIWEKLISSE